jgi:SAM-dependent methyltransferase
MQILDAIEERIWNVGERLIPGVTHDTAEVVRHKSSYLFFRKVIEIDLLSTSLGKSEIHILDIGCGVGHGTYMLADIPGAVVTGIDCSEDAIVYARMHYGRENITYVVADAVAFIKEMPKFDYVVSRHSLEHIADGIKLGAKCRFGARLMVNVPFGEPEGNPHHYVHFIRQDSFEKYPNRELFYEGLDGLTFCDYPQEKPNSIVCVSSRAGLPKVGPQFSFPLRAWHPEFLQGKWLQAIERQSELDILAQQQSNRDLELAHREANLVSRESDVTSRENDVYGRESRFGIREFEIGSRESQLATREADLSGRESRSGIRESELATREVQLASREAELSGRESRSGIRESELATRESQIATGEALLHSRQLELDRLESMLSQRETRLAGEQARLEELIRLFENRLIVRVYRKMKSLL